MSRRVEPLPGLRFGGLRPPPRPAGSWVRRSVLAIAEEAWTVAAAGAGAGDCSSGAADAGMVGAGAGAGDRLCCWVAVDGGGIGVCSAVVVDAVSAGVEAEDASGGMYCPKAGCGAVGRRRRAADVAS